MNGSMASAVALAGALALTAPAANAQSASPRLVFGAPVSLTGSQAKEGRLTQEGYQFWQEYVNAHGGLRIGQHRYSVDVRYRDDQSQPARSAALARSLIVDDHVAFLLGPYGSSQTFAAAAVAEAHGVPLVASGASAERIFNQGYRNVFGVESPARKYLAGIIEFAVRRTPRPQTVAISAASDAFSREVQQGAVQSANDHGLRVVFNGVYTPDAAGVARTASAIAAVHPDVVLNAGHLSDALAMHHALHAHHVAAKMYGYSVGPDTPEFRSTLGPDAQGVYGSAQWSPAVTYEAAAGFYPSARAYAAAFVRRFGHEPDYHDAAASAAGVAFEYALEVAGSTDPQAVRSALAGLNVTTFFGPLRFDSRGVNIYKPMVVNQVQNGQLVTIYPYRLANGKPIYPAPPWVERDTASTHP